MATALVIMVMVSVTLNTVDAMGDVCRDLPVSRVVVCEIQRGGILNQTFERCGTSLLDSDPRAQCEVCCNVRKLVCLLYILVVKSDAVVC